MFKPLNLFLFTQNKNTTLESFSFIHPELCQLFTEEILSGDNELYYYIVTCHSQHD